MSSGSSETASGSSSTADRAVSVSSRPSSCWPTAGRRCSDRAACRSRTSRPSSAGSRVPVQADDARSVSPGRASSHYAPSVPVVLADPGTDPSHPDPDNASDSSPPPTRGEDRAEAVGGPFAAVEVLASDGDLVRSAARLFDALHALDQAGLDLVIARAGRGGGPGSGRHGPAASRCHGYDARVSGLRIERGGPGGTVARVTLARPEAHNAFDACLIAELRSTFGGLRGRRRRTFGRSSWLVTDRRSAPAPTSAGCGRR